MSSVRIRSVIMIALVATLCAAGASWAEDGLQFSSIKASDLASTRENSFVSAIPGGRFVITVAHLAPSPEDAVVRGVPATCDSVRFRVDTLHVKRADGTVEVELGPDRSIAPGEAMQVVHDIDPSSAPGVPTSDLDLMGFRIRAEKASARCGVVASGLFFPEPTSRSPMSVGLIPDLGPSPALGSTGR